MPTLKELARLGKQALLTFVAPLLTELAALKARVEELLAENAALRARLDQLARDSKRQAAPFSRGRRKAQPKRPGRKPGRGRFSFRTLPTPDQWTAPPIEVRLPDPVCPCCGEALREHRADFAAVTDLPPQPKPIVQPYRVWVYRCPTCDTTVRAPHPDLAPDRTGPPPTGSGLGSWPRRTPPTTAWASRSARSPPSSTVHRRPPDPIGDHAGCLAARVRPGRSGVPVPARPGPRRRTSSTPTTRAGVSGARMPS